jgi:hypothetical protein
VNVIPGGGDNDGFLGATFSISNVQVYIRDGHDDDYNDVYAPFNNTVTGLNYVPDMNMSEEGEYLSLNEAFNGTNSVTLTNGKLSIRLGTPKDSAMTNFFTELPEGITTSNKDAKFFIFQGITDNYNQSVSSSDVMYMYADRDVTISGRYDQKFEWSDYTYSTIYAMFLKTGWNSLIFESQESDTERVSTIKTGKPSADGKWIYSARGSGGDIDWANEAFTVQIEGDLSLGFLVAYLEVGDGVHYDIFEEGFTCQWYRDGIAIPGATLYANFIQDSDVGKAFTVRVRGHGRDEESEPFIVPAGNGAPPAPTGVTATRDSSNPSTVYISWNPVSGASYYEIYYSSSENSSSYKDGESYTTSFTSVSNSTDSAVYFRVVAVNNAGQRGAPSSWISVAPVSGGGGITPATLAAHLATLSANTVFTPHNIMLKVTSSVEFETIKNALYGAPGKYVYLDLSGSNITTIPENAFFYSEKCTSLVGITIPYGVTSIGESAFLDCTNLASVTIPYGVTSIGEMALALCASLASITIPNSVTSIGDYAFGVCESLASIYIPNSVISIGDGALNGCTSLTSVTIPNSVTSIGEYIFHSCSSLASIIIPNSVTSIRNGTFQSCSSLANVTIPNSITSIGNSAFYECGSLASITIPNSVTSIGAYAFVYCTSLASVTFQGTIPSSWFNTVYSFNGNLREVFYAADPSNGTPGTYTRPNGSNTWTKR